MAKKRGSGNIQFIVEYEDGTEARFSIDRFTLRTGDHIARIIAGERQRGGTLPPGKIKEVRRAPFNEQC